MCFSGKRAEIIISSSQDNPLELFFKCKCEFFNFLEPDVDEFSSILHTQRVNDEVLLTSCHRRYVHSSRLQVVENEKKIEKILYVVKFIFMFCLLLGCILVSK